MPSKLCVRAYFLLQIFAVPTLLQAMDVAVDDNQYDELTLIREKNNSVPAPGNSPTVGLGQCEFKVDGLCSQESSYNGVYTSDLSILSFGKPIYYNRNNPQKVFQYNGHSWDMCLRSDILRPSTCVGGYGRSGNIQTDPHDAVGEPIFTWQCGDSGMIHNCGTCAFQITDCCKEMASFNGVYIADPSVLSSGKPIYYKEDNPHELFQYGNSDKGWNLCERNDTARPSLCQGGYGRNGFHATDPRDSVGDSISTWVCGKTGKIETC